MIKASWKKLTLDFKIPSGTSRGVLTQKDSWIVSIWNDNITSIVGKGEASIIKTLSPEWSEHFETKINLICENVTEYITAEGLKKLNQYPSIQLALETALLDLKNGGESIIFPSNFTTEQSSNSNQWINLDGRQSIYEIAD